MNFVQSAICIVAGILTIGVLAYTTYKIAYGWGRITAKIEILEKKVKKLEKER